MNAAGWRDRIVGYGCADPRTLVPNPENWHVHNASQQEAIGTLLGTMGWVQGVIVNRSTGRLIDGHERVRQAIENGEESVPVTYVELDENEERVALATFDSVGAVAVADDVKLRGLLERAKTLTPGLVAVSEKVERLFLEADEAVEPERAQNEGLSEEDYTEKYIRPLILTYPADEFAELVERLERIRASLGVGTNTEAILALVRDGYARYRTGATTD